MTVRGDGGEEVKEQFEKELITGFDLRHILGGALGGRGNCSVYYYSRVSVLWLGGIALSRLCAEQGASVFTVSMMDKGLTD